MSNITREQIQKINNRCKNDWSLDIQYYLFHNQKTLIKHIALNEEYYIQFKLNYNYKNQITLYFNKFHHKEGDYFATSSGLGKSKIIDEKQTTRKNINNLIELTEKLTDDELMLINSQTEVTKSPIFVASEEF